jgi:hypothetical protein
MKCRSVVEESSRIGKSAGEMTSQVPAIAFEVMKKAVSEEEFGSTG